MSSEQTRARLDAAEKVLQEAGPNATMHACEIVRRMRENGYSDPGLKRNPLYSTVGIDIRHRKKHGKPQRFDRPGVGRKPSPWTISLAKVAK